MPGKNSNDDFCPGLKTMFSPSRKKIWLTSFTFHAAIFKMTFKFPCFDKEVLSNYDTILPRIFKIFFCVDNLDISKNLTSIFTREIRYK